MNCFFILSYGDIFQFYSFNHHVYVGGYFPELVAQEASGLATAFTNEAWKDISSWIEERIQEKEGFTIRTIASEV